MSVMLVSLVSSASSQLAEPVGPRLLGNAECDDPDGTEPEHVGSAAANPAKLNELATNPAVTSNVFANKTILTIT